MTAMRVIVTGSQSRDVPLVGRVLDSVLYTVPAGDTLTVVQNGDEGADAAALRWAENLRDFGAAVDMVTVPWDPEDGPIGVRCSATMVGAGADLVLAFPDGRAGGTRRCVALARAAGIPVQMFETLPADGRVLYIVVCGAPPAQGVDMLVELAQLLGWDVCVVVTEAGHGFLTEGQVESLVEQTGHPVRTNYSRAGHPSALPRPDAIAVAPATAHTLAAWASGHADTLPLGLLGEAVGGRRIPVAAAPFINRDQAGFEPIAAAVGLLRRGKVRIVDRVPHQPGTGFDVAAQFPWSAIAAKIHDAYVHSQRIEHGLAAAAAR